MGTKAIIRFEDEDTRAWVYQQYDGYPSGVQSCITKALAYAWTLPRFEADEFAAAYLAANKKEGGGNFRICTKPSVTWAEFVYVVEQTPEGLFVRIGHCAGEDELGRPDYQTTWEGYVRDMHEAYANDDEEEDAA